MTSPAPYPNSPEAGAPIGQPSAYPSAPSPYGQVGPSGLGDPAVFPAGSAVPPSPYVAAGPPPTRKSGVGAWLQFLWTLAPIPVLGHIGWLIGAIVSMLSNRHRGRVADGNARQALNWALTVNIANIAFIVVAIISMTLAVQAGGGSARTADPGVIVYLSCLFLLMVAAIATLIVGIIGAVKASRGEIYIPTLAIPFLRTTQADATFHVPPMR